MTSTVLATFDRLEDARNAVHELQESGFDRSDIGLALYDAENAYTPYIEDVSGAEGMSFGAVVGSLFGAVVGLAAITIPGVGPVIAAGPLAAAIGALTGAGIGAASGAVTGGISASLIKLGVPEEDTHYYAESLRQGAALVSVTAYETDSDRAAYLLRKHNPVDIEKRIAQWRARGWSAYDPMVDPFTAEELAELDDTREDALVREPDIDEEYPRAVRHYPYHLDR
jgi:hypothetical protein